MANNTLRVFYVTAIVPGYPSLSMQLIEHIVPFLGPRTTRSMLPTRNVE